jgi:uncharacterized Zn ribbon protein
MALMQVCPRCRDAYRLGEIRGQLCAQCTRDIAAEVKRDDDKTALANDLVRGNPK